MSDQLARTDLSKTDLVCWEAALEAFGVTVRTGKPLDSYLIKQHLHRAGWTTTSVAAEYTGATMAEMMDDDAPMVKEPSLSRFIACHPTGDYLISTAGHCMALRSGQLTDTDLAATGRRRVTDAWAVTRAGAPHPPLGLATVSGTVAGPGVDKLGGDAAPRVLLDDGGPVVLINAGATGLAVGQHATFTGTLVATSGNLPEGWPTLRLDLHDTSA